MKTEEQNALSSPPDSLRWQNREALRSQGALVRKRAAIGKAAANATIYALLTITAVIVLFPVIWMILTSFKSESEAQQFPPTFLPVEWTIQAYQQVFELYPFGQFLINAVLLSGIVTIGTLLSCSMAAFALVHLRFRGRELIFLLVLGTMMIPFAATMVPVFIGMSQIGWIDTWYPLIVPAFLGNAYGIFLLRQLFRGVPRSLGEAAKLDGCNPLRILTSIYAPLSTGAFTALGVVTFINCWNNLIAPVIFINDENLMPVSVGLAYLNAQGSAIWSWLMAASTLSVIPLLIIYAVGQKYVVAGFTVVGADR